MDARAPLPRVRRRLPEPGVTGAALAAITKNVGDPRRQRRAPAALARSGSPRSGRSSTTSRAAVSASRSQPAGSPTTSCSTRAPTPTAKEDLPRRIDTVQRLWRGETVSLPGHDGNPVEVHTLPRPVQPELPVWLTSAGPPATFERAGTLGVNVLTHLLGQSIEQLAENLERYRTAWREAGHPGDGRVTLMMHTFLDRDADAARETAREPMKAYLSTAVGLLRDVASAFPTFAGRGKNTDDLFKSLTPEEMDQLLEVAAHRYLSTSGLFGTPTDVADVVERVSAAGVDEVACLIDFGVETDLALRSLDLLLEAKHRVDSARTEAPVAEIPRSEPEIDPDWLGSEARGALGRISAHLTETIQGLAELAAFQAIGRRRAVFLADITAYQKKRRALLYDLATQTAGLEIAMGLGGLAVAVLGALLSAQGWFAHQWLPLLVLVSVAAFLPVAEISQVGRQLADTVASTRRLRVVESELEPIADGALPIPANPEVHFEAVRFTYPGRAAPALDRVTFDMRPGSTVAVVGASGAGKSTVANLLLRFWDPQEGRIMLGGTDLRQLRLDDLRRHIALVAQDTYLFNDTLAANIRLAGREYPRRTCGLRSAVAALGELSTDSPRASRPASANEACSCRAVSGSDSRSRAPF